MLNPKIVLLRATSSHLDLAQQGIAEVNLPTSHHRLPLDKTALGEFLANPARFLILAIEEERVVGSLYGYALRHPYRREPQFFLYGIDVRPEYRNQQIGSALVDEFITEAKLAGAFEVWVLTSESNKAAMVMYAHSGLERSSTDDVMLSLTLSMTLTDQANRLNKQIPRQDNFMCQHN
jgi:ribosomal protein S18 acetylase RimI-like enzyme